MWRLFTARRQESKRRNEELRHERGKLAAAIIDADRHRVDLDRKRLHVEQLMRDMLNELEETRRA